MLLFESFDKASGPKACREPNQTRPRTSLLFEPVENYLWINPSRLRSKDKKLPFEPVENRVGFDRGLPYRSSLSRTIF